MKTILEVTGKMNRGGAETMLVDIIRQTHKELRYVFLINTKSLNDKSGEYDTELMALGCKFYYIGTVWDMGIPAYTKAFLEICNRIHQEVAPIDVVHCHMNSKCGTVLRAAKMAGIKKRIAHSHAEIKFNGSLPRVIGYCMELYFQKILINKYATDYWGCSKKALPSLYTRVHIQGEHCVVIKNAIDIHKFVYADRKTVDSFRVQLGIPEGKKVLGSVGRIARVKNTRFIIELFRSIHIQHPDTCLVIVGAEQDAVYSKEIHELVQAYGLKQDGIFTGVQSQLEYIYNSFDFFLGASLREGRGLVSVEAQACGVPCVLSTGFPEEVDIGLGMVRFVDSFDIEQWTTCILETLKSGSDFKELDKPSLVASLAQSGYDAVVEAQKVRALYEKDEGHTVQG